MQFQSYNGHRKGYNMNVDYLSWLWLLHIRIDNQASSSFRESWWWLVMTIRLCRYQTLCVRLWCYIEKKGWPQDGHSCAEICHVRDCMNWFLNGSQINFHCDLVRLFFFVSKLCFSQKFLSYSIINSYKLIIQVRCIQSTGRWSHKFEDVRKMDYKSSLWDRIKSI